MHCALLQSGEIQVIVGDGARDGVGGQQYCGLWSLTSTRRQFNAFGNSYAGLLPGEIRGRAPELQALTDASAVLTGVVDSSYPVDVRAEYAVKGPYYVDHALSLTDREDVRADGCDFREVSWCCYMNCPEDVRLHFLSDGEWRAYISPRHGVDSNIAPGYVRDIELERRPSEMYSEAPDERPFHWDRADLRFDEPFYYGRLGKMALILVFDTPQWLRFYCSPTGGGESLLPHKACPAWDFEWVIPEAAYEVGKEYSFRSRLIYKEFISEDDVLEEFRKARDELGFEQTPGSS
jgi:hypothetical protein